MDLKNKDLRENILALIKAERYRQDEKWGVPQNNSFAEWGNILAEEAGELCMELNEQNIGKSCKERVVEEAIQVAAVAVAIIEQYDNATAITVALNDCRRKVAQQISALKVSVE